MTRATARMLCLLPLLLLGACDSGDSERPPRIVITVVNAAPGFENLSIRRGSTGAAEIASLGYGARTSARFDSGPYNFTVETLDSLTRQAELQLTFSDDLAPEQTHLYVLAEQNQALLPLRFARPVFSRENAEWELNIVNAVESLADVDFYAVPPGTDISTVAPTGSVQFGELVTAGTLPPDTYQFILTEPGNASNVLYVSNEIDLPAGLSIEITIAPDTNGSPNRVTLLGSTEVDDFTLRDTTIPETARFINGAGDQLARDVYLDGDFMTPFAADIGFVSVGDFVDLPDGTSRISITPAGNPSVVEAELIDTLLPGSIYSILIAGPAGTIAAQPVIDNRIRNYTYPRLTFLNTVSTYERLSIWVVAPGTDISTVLPNVTLLSPGASPRTLIQAETFEITVQDSATETVVLGPLSVSMEAGGLYTILLHDSGDGTTVSALLLDDFQ